MAHKAIREVDGKRMLARLFKEYSNGKYYIPDKYVAVGPDTSMSKLAKPTQMANHRKVGRQTRYADKAQRKKQTCSCWRKL